MPKQCLWRLDLRQFRSSRTNATGALVTSYLYSVSPGTHLTLGTHEAPHQFIHLVTAPHVLTPKHLRVQRKRHYPHVPHHHHLLQTFGSLSFARVWLSTLHTFYHLIFTAR